MKDLLLNPTTHDLTVNTDLAFAEGADYVVQKVKIRLWFFLGEWFLDTREGTPFYQLIFVKGTKQEHIDAALKDRILGTAGITRLISYSSSFSRADRKFAVRFEAQCSNGESTGVLTLEVP